jgi:hypothetical protein
MVVNYISDEASGSNTNNVSIEEWLKGFNMHKYWSTFEKNGYDSVEAVKELDNNTLTMIGVALGHQAIILRNVRLL